MFCRLKGVFQGAKLVKIRVFKGTSSGPFKNFLKYCVSVEKGFFSGFGGFFQRGGFVEFAGLPRGSWGALAQTPIHTCRWWEAPAELNHSFTFERGREGGRSCLGLKSSFLSEFTSFGRRLFHIEGLGAADLGARPVPDRRMWELQISVAGWPGLAWPGWLAGLAGWLALSPVSLSLPLSLPLAQKSPKRHQ